MDTVPAKTKTKAKRPSKGMRKHTRRMKQEARSTRVPATNSKARKLAA